VIRRVLDHAGGWTAMAFILASCYIVVLSVLIWYIKREERRLPLSYLTNVGQLSFMGYGLVPSDEPNPISLPPPTPLLAPATPPPIV
jgi:preprotein translocase subunit SecY